MHTTHLGASGLFLITAALLVAGCAPVKDSLTVATWNIKHGRGLDGSVDLERTTHSLETLGADVIALQEVDVGATRSGSVDQPEVLGEALGMTSAFGPFMAYQGGAYGLAMLTKLPPSNIRVWPLPNGNEPRVALAFDVDLAEGRPVTLICVHFDWVADDAYRFEQAATVAARIDALETPWILLGDYNDVPGSRTLDLFGRLGVPVPKTGSGSDTFPADAPDIEIDHITVGPKGAWVVGEAEVIPEPVASDHLAVVTTLRLVR